MAKSIKFKNDTFIDATGVLAKTGTVKTLNTLISNINTLFLGTQDSATERYYFIGTLGKGDNNDASTLRLTGTSGGFYFYQQVTFDLTISSRSIGVAGNWYGKKDGWDWFDIKVYKSTSDNYYRVYYHRKARAYHGRTNIMAMGSGMYNLACNTEATTPTGDLVLTIDNNNLTCITDEVRIINYNNNDTDEREINNNITDSVIASWGTKITIGTLAKIMIGNYSSGGRRIAIRTKFGDNWNSWFFIKND